MDEPVRDVQAEDEPRADSLPEVRVQVPLRAGVDHRQEGDVGDVPQTGEQLQRLLGCCREPPELLDHQVDHVVGEALGADPGDIPPKDPGASVEVDQALFVESGEELDREEGVTGRLLLDQLRERSDLVTGAMGVSPMSAARSCRDSGASTISEMSAPAFRAPSSVTRSGWDEDTSLAR